MGQCAMSLCARTKISQIMSGCCWLPAMRPVTLRPSRFDEVFEAIAHHVLEGHALADDVVAVTALEQRLLDARANLPRSRQTARSSLT